MAGIFRIRYFLSRVQDKHPLLFLEPLELEGPSPETKELPIINLQDLADADANAGQFARLSLDELGNKQLSSWFIYPQAKKVRLSHLQPVHKNKEALDALARELRSHGLAKIRSAELEPLWMASIKGVALKQLRSGQLIAATGYQVFQSHHFYCLVPEKTLEQPDFQASSKTQDFTLRISQPSKFETKASLSLLRSYPGFQFCRILFPSKQLISQEQCQKEGTLYQLHPLNEALGKAPIDCFFINTMEGVADSKKLMQVLETIELPPELNWSQDEAHKQLQHVHAKSLSILHSKTLSKLELSPEQQWVCSGQWLVERKQLGEAYSEIISCCSQQGGLEQEAVLERIQLPRSTSQTLIEIMLAHKELIHSDTFLLARSILHPNLLGNASEDYRSKYQAPPRLSPVGLNLYQSVWEAGEKGSPIHKFKNSAEQEQLRALCRSGWLCAMPEQQPHYFVSTAFASPNKGQPKGRDSYGDAGLEDVLQHYRGKMPKQAQGYQEREGREDWILAASRRDFEGSAPRNRDGRGYPPANREFRRDSRPHHQDRDGYRGRDSYQGRDNSRGRDGYQGRDNYREQGRRPQQQDWNERPRREDRGESRYNGERNYQRNDRQGAYQRHSNERPRRDSSGWREGQDGRREFRPERSGHRDERSERDSRPTWRDNRAPRRNNREGSSNQRDFHRREQHSSRDGGGYRQENRFHREGGQERSWHRDRDSSSYRGGGRPQGSYQRRDRPDFQPSEQHFDRGEGRRRPHRSEQGWKQENRNPRQQRSSGPHSHSHSHSGGRGRNRG